MKKIFALALAAVMTAGMTTVAFAADEVPKAYLLCYRRSNGSMYTLIPTMMVSSL